MIRKSTNTSWVQIKDLKELKDKEGYEIKFSHSGELDGYEEIFIVTETKNFIKVICADDPYHDVEMALDIKSYQNKIDSGEIEARVSADKTFLGIEILESLEAVAAI